MFSLSETAFESYLIKNVQLKTVYWPSVKAEDIEGTMNDIRSNTFQLNVFVIGVTNTLNQVLASVRVAMLCK